MAGRLARHGAGIQMTFSQTTPASLAKAIISNLGRQATWPPIRVDGARRAARAIADLVRG